LPEEYLEIIDENGCVKGQAERGFLHENPDLIHRTVHVIVETPDGDIVLQLRSMDKSIQPGKWDTSVGGHFIPGETPEEAAVRETEEELCFKLENPQKLYEYLWRSECESQLVTTFRATYPGPLRWNPDEITEARPWSIGEIRSQLGTGLFTPNFEVEFGKYCQWLETRET